MPTDHFVLADQQTEAETGFSSWGEVKSPSPQARPKEISSDSSCWAQDDLGFDPTGNKPPLDIGSWRVTGVLGRGGYGVVYRAQERGGAGRAAALKVLPTSARKLPEAVARFFRESSTVARLNHPGIVKFYDFGCSRERYFFTMELVEGRDLHRVVREDGILLEQRAAAILAQVAEALSAIASLGFVHRDLKPENIVLQAGDQAKLIDFGLVKVADTASITAPGDILGTPFFMAPEYIATGDPPDIRADVYALGIIFHFLLTGRYPFEGTSPAEVFDMHLEEASPAPSVKNVRVSPQGDWLCKWLLEKDPEARPDPAAAAAAFSDLASA